MARCSNEAVSQRLLLEGCSSCDFSVCLIYRVNVLPILETLARVPRVEPYRLTDRHSGPNHSVRLSTYQNLYVSEPSSSAECKRTVRTVLWR